MRQQAVETFAIAWARARGNVGLSKKVSRAAGSTHRMGCKPQRFDLRAITPIWSPCLRTKGSWLYGAPRIFWGMFLGNGACILIRALGILCFQSRLAPCNSLQVAEPRTLRAYHLHKITSYSVPVEHIDEIDQICHLPKVFRLICGGTTDGRLKIWATQQPADHR